MNNGWIIGMSIIVGTFVLIAILSLIYHYLNGPSDAAKRKKPPYDWFRAAGLTKKPSPIPPGTHIVDIAEVQHFDEKGDLICECLTGDQAIVVVFEDGHGRRAKRQYSLRDAAPLACLLSDCNPSGLHTLREKHIAPSKFKDERFAKKMLLNKRCWIRVEVVNGFVIARSIAETRN